VTAGSRHDGDILCWDIRATMTAVCSLPRVSDTNQRIGFDVEPMGKHLITGSRDCKAIVYDLTLGVPVANVTHPDVICGEWQGCWWGACARVLVCPCVSASGLPRGCLLV
jgi:hypothetical protein